MDKWERRDQKRQSKRRRMQKHGRSLRHILQAIVKRAGKRKE